MAQIFERFPFPSSPCPLPSGTPPGEMWAPLGTPPDIRAAVPTVRCWMAPCPCCLEGWCAVIPDGSRCGYRLAHEIGCSDGCEPADVAWWSLWRAGELPPRERVEASERGRRYAFGAAKHAARRIVEAADPLARLRREAYSLGGIAAGTGTDPQAVVRALAVAAKAAGVPAEAALPAITTNVTAGLARPRRIAP